MTRRQTTTHGRRLRIPVITRKQWRTRIADLKGLLRHVNEAAQLRQEEAAQRLTGAEQLIAGLRITVDGLEQRVGQLNADAVDTSVLRQQLAAAGAANEALRTEYFAVKSELEEATAVTVAPGYRDTEDTQPMYAETWQQHMERLQKTRRPGAKPMADIFGGVK